MDKKKTISKRQSFQLICLVAFAGMSLACSSSKEVYEGIDGFVDGWQLGKTLVSEINVESIDSLNTSATNDLAMIEEVDKNEIE